MASFECCSWILVVTWYFYGLEVDSDVSMFNCTGKTQLINHFLVNKSWYIVDLPGYG